MNWIALILQMFSFRKSLHDSQALIEAAHNMAERGKRYLASFLILTVAMLFLFSGFLLAIINLGLQLDRDGVVSFSGLMISSTILIGLGLLSAMASMMLGRPCNPSRPKPVDQESPRENKIKDLLEEFLVTFLTRLMEKKAHGTEPPKQD